MIVSHNSNELETHPICGLLIYAMKQPLHNEVKSLVITKHHLKLHNGRPELGEVQHFSESELGDMLRAIEAREDDGVGLIPPNLLFQQGHLTAWYVSGSKRDMWIQNHNDTSRLMSLKVIWPNLIFIVTGETLRVFSYLGTQRPTEQTQLFHAPLMNIGSDGRVCLGTATHPRKRGIASIPEWEGVMFNTRFSHTNHPHTLRVKGKGTISNEQHTQFWQSKASSLTKVKASELQPYHRKLGEILQWTRHNG